MEKNDKKVSVIIPVYNVEKYIEKCLESVLNQTLKKIEIICINDGSRDKSMEIVYDKAQKDNRIVIVEKENGGLSSARNAGLEKATGEYVLFLDSDDTLVLNALEILYDKAHHNQLDNIYFGATTIYESIRVKIMHYRRYHKYYHRQCIYPDALSGPEMFHKLVANKEYRMSACLQMPRRQFLIDNDFRFYEGILHEDNLFSIQVILAASKVMVVNEALYIRLMRAGSIMTAKNSINSSWGYYVCLKEMLKYVSGGNYTAEVHQSINYTLMSTQREAILPIRGMTKEEVLKELEHDISREERLHYEITVLNNEWIRQQSQLRVKIRNRLG